VSIKYDKLLKEMEKGGLTSYSIKNKDSGVISQSTLRRIQAGQSITMTSLSKICERLKKQPKALIEWVDDGEHNE
jgi:DNA-binding Xre family transcriptional regulator